HDEATLTDDAAGNTDVLAAATQERIAGKKAGANRTSAEKVGKAIAERLLSKKVDKVIFDRGGFLYHGKVKALADAAREGGLKFENIMAQQHSGGGRRQESQTDKRAAASGEETKKEGNGDRRERGR